LRLFFLVLGLVFIPFAAYAHGGGLNKEGCHNNRQTGDYHCHRGAKAPSRFQGPSPLPVFSGRPKITDGDTIRIGNIRIRLHGIDAPEAKQTCTAGGKQWPCGRAATKALTEIIGDRSVSCNRRDVDRYGRIVAVCRAGAINLNAWMVGQGWAVAYRRFSMDYVRDEGEAKQERKGLWQGEFVMPWDWRLRK
jgi:endonuclease YncB( thermonuclease family)